MGHPPRQVSEASRRDVRTRVTADKCERTVEDEEGFVFVCVRMERRTTAGSLRRLEHGESPLGLLPGQQDPRLCSAEIQLLSFARQNEDQ